MKNKLVLEINKKYVKEDGIIKTRVGTIMITPSIGEDYWQFRVKLSEKQAIIGFPKFGTIGIGFAKETDWNTNLPFSSDAQKIFKHIEENKGDKSISDADCIKAIKMIQKVAKEFQTERKVMNKN